MSIRSVSPTQNRRHGAGTLLGSALALRAPASTGGFAVLSRDEARQLVRDNVLDPISMERPIHRGTFKVQRRTPSPDGTPRYSYWKPEDLWKWVSRPESSGRMPDTNEKIWYEDWWALYYTFGPTPTVPAWARALDKRNAATQPAQGGNAGGGFATQGGGLFGGQGGGGQGGDLFGGDRDDLVGLQDLDGAIQPHRQPNNEARLEAERLENERQRLEMLEAGTTSLFGMPTMTGVNGRFWLVGAPESNPTAAEIREGFRTRMRQYRWSDALFVRTPQLRRARCADVVCDFTLVEYEFLGLTRDQGDQFITYVQRYGGTGPLGDTFWRQIFILPTVPRVLFDDLPGWGLFMHNRLRATPRLDLSPEQIEDWRMIARTQREARAEAGP